MMDLLKHELFKIISRKSVLIVAVLLLLTYGLFIASRSDHYHNASQEYKPYERVITEADRGMVLKVFEDEERYNKDTPPSERGLLQDIWDIQSMQAGYERQLEEIRAQLDRSVLGSYEYKQHALHEQLLLEKGPPSGQVYYNKPWAYMIDMIDQFGVAFMGAMILIGLASLYSEEYSTGMDSLLLSSRKGKGKLITAKYCAAIIYTSSCCFLFALINIVVHALLFGNLDGANTPLYSLSKYGDSHPFGTSPYSLMVGQFYAIQLGVHLVGSVAFGLAVMFISSLSASSFVTLFVSGCILGVPYLLNDLFNMQIQVIEWLSFYSYSQLMRVTRLFNYFQTVNLGNIPVLYPVAALSVITVVTGLLVWGTRLVFRKHQVSA